MRYKTLTAKEDYSLGEIGLMIDGVRMMDYPSVAMEGRLIAHDILEHQNGLHNIGSIGDELEALGGVWYVRGQHGDITRDYNVNTPSQHIAADISNMAMMFVDGVGLNHPIPRTYSHDYDEDFRDIINLARHDYLRELQDRDISDYNQQIPEYFDACLHCMRSGFNKAARRFANIDANGLFWEIAKTVDPHAKHIEYEGQQFRLGYDSNQVQCYEIIEDEYYL